MSLLRSLVYCSVLWLAVLPAWAEDGLECRGTVRVLLDEGCPIARYHTLTLRNLHETFNKLGIRFEGYFPNLSATKLSVGAFAKKFEIPFPVQVDTGQTQAREMKAMIVPEVFVYDRHQKLVYRGRIDDTHVEVGKKRPAARQHDLKETLHALIGGKPILVAQTKPVGCLITFANPTPTKEDPQP